MRLLVMAFVAMVVSGDSDFHFIREDDMVMPGIRRTHRTDRYPRTPRPLVDSPIFFPGASVGGGEVPVPVDPGNTHVVSESDDGTLELPEDIDELDISSLLKLNSISNMTNFASLFGLDLPQSSPSLGEAVHQPGFTIGERIGPSRDAGEVYEMANCKPELVTVPLDLPKEAGTMFFPTCIRLEQCGGCCFGPLLTCRPSVTKVVKVKVLKVSSSSSSNSGVSTSRGRGGRGRRRRRQSQQSYHIVEAVKHTACECGCKVREDDCNSDLHSYREGECSCVCKNKDEQAKCEQQNTTKYWDNDSCNCFCRKEQQCSTGEIFSQVTCSCERQLSARHGSFSPDLEAPFRRRRKPVRVPLA